MRHVHITNSIHGRRRSDLNKYDCQNFQQVFTGVPVHVKHIFSGSTKFQTGFHMSKQTFRHSKDLIENMVDLEIQIFEVGSPR